MLLACTPKSGSTFLARLLCEITGLAQASVAVGHNGNEQDLCKRKLRKHRHDRVCCQHTRGTDDNVALLNRFHIKPVVHTRNIFDTTVSIHGHLEKFGFGQGSMGHLHPEYEQMQQDEQLNYLIRVQLPWYFSFLMSWRDAQRHTQVLRTTYEELFAQPVETVDRILQFYGLPSDQDQIDRALDSVQAQSTRKNVGVSGRGLEILNQSHRAAILELADAWRVPRSEFEAFGLSDAMRANRDAA